MLPVSFNFPLMDRWSGCWYYRLEVPRRELLKKGLPVYENEPSKADIQVFSRAQTPGCIKLIKRLKQDGKKIVCDLDDLIWAIDPRNPYSEDVTPSLLQYIDEAVGLSDLVTVTTRNLKSAVKRRFPGKKIEILPNFVDKELPREVSAVPELDPDKFVLLASGSISHMGDFSILPHIAKLFSPSEVQWVMFGPEDFKNIVPNAIWISVQKTYDYIATLVDLGQRFKTIGVVPLEKNAFNESKSRLKMVEYGNASIPGVYSSVGEYAETRRGEMVPPDAPATSWACGIRLVMARHKQLSSAAKQSIENCCTADLGVGMWERAYNQLGGN